MVLFADPGAEKSATYAFIPVFRDWMSERGIASEIVRYQPRNFKHWPPYAGIAENMLTNATLPSVVFGGGSCSQKWKAAPQDAWTAQWEPARRCWDAGGRVVKLIGYDASGRDTQRYHHAVGCEDPRYAYRYPLREWAWSRADCEARIARAGLPVPPKSSCYFCGSIKPDEVSMAVPRKVLVLRFRHTLYRPGTDRLRRHLCRGSRGPRLDDGAGGSGASRSRLERRRPRATDQQRPLRWTLRGPRPRWLAPSRLSCRASPLRMTRTAWVFHFANLQESGPMKTFTDPFRIPCPLPCGNHGRGGKCRQRLPRFDRCVAYDRRVEEPRYGTSHFCQRLSLKVRTSILGALSPMAAMPPS